MWETWLLLDQFTLIAWSLYLETVRFYMDLFLTDRETKDIV